MSGINKHFIEQAVNYELIAALIASIGMMAMSIQPLTGKLIISFGIAGLIVLYIIQFFEALKYRHENKIVMLTLNHISMIILLAGMMLTIHESSLKLHVLILGWSFLVISCIINVKECKSKGLAFISSRQVRILMILIVSVIFVVGF